MFYRVRLWSKDPTHLICTLSSSHSFFPSFMTAYHLVKDLVNLYRMLNRATIRSVFPLPWPIFCDSCKALFQLLFMRWCFSVFPLVFLLKSLHFQTFLLKVVVWEKPWSHTIKAISIRFIILVSFWLQGDLVTVVFHSADPRNDLMTMKSFLAVEKMNSSSQWETVYVDSHWETKWVKLETYMYEQDLSPHCVCVPAEIVCLVAAS